MSGGGGHGGGGGMRWLLTYADLITLLMVFFVVLFAMANVDKQKYQALAGSLNQALHGGLGVLPGPGGSGTGSMPADLEQFSPAEPTLLPAPADVQPGQQPDRLEETGAALAMDLERLGRFHVYSNRRGITISLLGSALFNSGEAKIRPEARPILDAIAARIASLPNDISVEGSADDRPIATHDFPSNWELSVRRATEVVRYMVEQRGLDPARFIAVGYAEQRPVFDNQTPEGRAGNRRVDIVILRERQDVTLGEQIQP